MRSGYKGAQLKTLKTLLKDVEIIRQRGSLDIGISGISHDSRKVEEGYCFVAIKGFKVDGLNYVEAAIKRGAAVIVSQAPPLSVFEDVCWVQVMNDRQALSKMSAEFYDHPSQDMTVIGVTGTNGKTTVASLVAAILSRQAGTGLIGTLGMSGLNCPGDEKGSFFRKTALTTPEAPEIMAFMSEARSVGCRQLVMEVSSVALKLQRVEEIHFSQGIFTSFSGDHLDFHQTMADYFESKLRLFQKLSVDDWAVINIDDPSSGEILEALECKYLTFGFSSAADVRPLHYNLSLKGIEATLKTPKGELEIKSPLVGRVNVLNILAAVSSALIQGISFEDISGAVGDFKPVKGRLDFVYQGDFSVMIDYAHTDNALESLLKSLREVVSGRIILVFGAGGSRDKTKRPRMGEVASVNADLVVVTSDNPRQEEPADIIEDIVEGFELGFRQYIIEVDRERAIKRALGMARKDDLVVIAGKGHEDYQIFADRTIHFDDFEVVERLLKGRSAVEGEV
jgi:UDP-N-acetylmuramoyl-L-alanyl-D-glutamate--2,6-diaminopimelate ligase